MQIKYNNETLFSDIKASRRVLIGALIILTIVCSINLDSLQISILENRFAIRKPLVVISIIFTIFLSGFTYSLHVHRWRAEMFHKKHVKIYTERGIRRTWDSEKIKYIKAFPGKIETLLSMHSEIHNSVFDLPTTEMFPLVTLRKYEKPEDYFNDCLQLIFLRNKTKLKFYLRFLKNTAINRVKTKKIPNFTVKYFLPYHLYAENKYCIKFIGGNTEIRNLFEEFNGLVEPDLLRAKEGYPRLTSLVGEIIVPSFSAIVSFFAFINYLNG